MRIAFLEDDPILMRNVVDLLKNRLLTQVDEPVFCVPFHDGETLRNALRSESFDLLVLDCSTPDLNVLELLIWLRKKMESKVPVVILSAHNYERDVVYALDAGANDFIVKPFRPLELVARLRRLVTPVQSPPRGAQERFGPWVFDRSASSVQIEAQAGKSARRVPLSASEFHMALALFRNLGRPVSRAHLFERAGRGSEPVSRALDSQIYRLRTKLCLNAENGIRLHTVYGLGYRLEFSEASAGAPAPSTREINLRVTQVCG
jgi:DNA-binding response OmpR family regulator